MSRDMRAHTHAHTHTHIHKTRTHRPLGHSEALVGREDDAVAHGQVRAVAEVGDVVDLDVVLLGRLDVPARRPAPAEHQQTARGIMQSVRGTRLDPRVMSDVDSFASRKKIQSIFKSKRSICLACTLNTNLNRRWDSFRIQSQSGGTKTCLRPCSGEHPPEKLNAPDFGCLQDSCVKPKPFEQTTFPRSHIRLNYNSGAFTTPVSEKCRTKPSLQVPLRVVQQVRRDCDPDVPLVALHPGVQDYSRQLPSLAHSRSIADHEPCR